MSGPSSWPGSGPNRPRRFQRTDGGARSIRSQTQPFKARITAVTSQTQPFKVNIAIRATKTQPFRVRIKQTVQKTQPFKMRVTATTKQTQPFLTRIQQTVLKTQPFKARITAVIPKTQPFKTRITAVARQTQPFRVWIGTPNLTVLPPAAPGLTVQYGNFKLDETNGILIMSEPDTADTAIFGNWYCEFRVRLTPERETGNLVNDTAAFDALVAAVESDQSGLRVPRQRLLVKLDGAVLRDWNFNQAAQTAFLIQPELSLLRVNRREATYGFRVRCQVPGNVPGNFFRRESLTSSGDALRERRTCSITATWTSSLGQTSLANYGAHGDDFFNAYLPSNRTDQYGNVGQWIRADEAPIATNDELSLTTATRLYWECFAGRRDSFGKVITTIGERRIFVAPSTWVASANGNALQNYLDGGDAQYAKMLPPPLEPNASWVLVDEEPSYNDRDGPVATHSPVAGAGGILTVVRTYHEVVKGLRRYDVNTTTLPQQTRVVVVEGVYYQTGPISAYTNYSNGIRDLVNGVLAGLTPPVTRFESKSVPKVEHYDTIKKRLSFRWTINELCYPQGPSTDDPDITISTLDLRTDVPFDAQTVMNGIPVTRLQRVEARFTAVVDYTANQDPAKLWATKFRSFVLNAVATKLGGSPVVDLLDEQVAVGLHGNTLAGTLFLLVTGGSVLSMRVTQILIEVPSRDFAARADGTEKSAYPYRNVSEKILRRTAIYEYVAAGGGPANVFAPGGTGSGFGFTDTGISARDSIDQQNAAGPLALGTGWFIDRRANEPYLNVDIPTTRGVGFNTVIHVQTETWRFLLALEPGTSIP